jgi:Holliday junction resolvase
MSNPQKEKGSEWERNVAAYLRQNGWPEADRRYGAGNVNDKGDIIGVPGFTIEAKNHKTHDFSGWLREAEVERVNAGTRFGVVLAKRSRKPVGEAYVVMTFDTFIQIMKEMQ